MINSETNELLNKLNKSTPVIWEETFTKLQFEATLEEVKDALYDLNRTFHLVGMVTVELLLTNLAIDPSYLDSEKLKSGWIHECFSYFDGAWIEYDIGHRIEDNKVIFELSPPRERGPCPSCYDCEGFSPNCDELNYI